MSVATDNTAPRPEASVIVLNYRTPALVVDCLRSLSSEVEPGRHEVVVVDNASPDNSAAAIERAISDEGWGAWARVVRSPVNGGFAAGNNVGVRATTGAIRVLINSDTIVRPGALRTLLDAFGADDSLGLVGPRLEWPDGERQVSTFRFRTPLTELIAASRSGWLGDVFLRHVSARELEGRADDLDWVSFACVAVRATVFERVGALDETYFMYFEDMDYCRRARDGGFKVAYEPAARVVHLRGGTSDVKKATRERTRRPGYFYAARAHYFRRWYGAAGYVLANVFWMAGTLLALLMRRSRAVEREWRDIWADPRGGRPGSAPPAPAEGAGVAHA